MGDAVRRQADPLLGSSSRKVPPRVSAARQGVAGGNVQLLRALQRTAGNQAVNNLLLRRNTARRPGPRRGATGDDREVLFQIDSDGDQRNDLDVRITAASWVWHPVDPAMAAALGLDSSLVAPHDPTTFTVEITPSGYVGTQKLQFDWPNPYAALSPSVVAVTDGKGPTTILLTPGASQELLLIYPPTRTADAFQFHVEAGGKSTTFEFSLPTDTAPEQRVALSGAVSTVEGLTTGGISTVDVTLGAQGDKFRLSVMPLTTTSGLFAVTTLPDRPARGAPPARIALSGPVSLAVVNTGPISLGLDLNGDGKADIQIFDQLEHLDQPDLSGTGPGNGTSEERHHLVRATGPALGDDVLFPFTVRGDKVQSDQMAIGGITALDIPLGPFGDKFRLTFQPTAPDRALFGLTASDFASPREGFGTEVALSGPFSVQIVDSQPDTVGIDLNGDHKPELEILDQVEYWDKDEDILHDNSERNHTVWVAGSAMGAQRSSPFAFMVREGRLFPGRNGHVHDDPNEWGRAAAANAMAVGSLAQQAEQGSIEQQIAMYENAMAAVRAKAAKDGIIPREAYDTWAALSLDMIALEPQVKAQQSLDFWAAIASGPLEFQRQSRLHSVNADLQLQAAGHASELGDTLDWVGAGSDHSAERLGGKLWDALSTGAWAGALSCYRELVGLLDDVIINQLEQKKGPDAEEEAEEAKSLKAHQETLQDVADHNAKRLLAVFLPDEKFRTEQGYVAEVPLSLYYWKEDGSWHLKDITNPEHTHEYTKDADENDTEPPDSLWDKLNSDRFPVGVIRYVMPNGTNGSVQTTDPLTWRKFLGYLGMALAVAAMVAAPFDAPVAVTALRLMSAVAMASAAAMDLKEHYEEGNLGLTTALLDIGQIVAAVAGGVALNANILRTTTISLAQEGAIDAAAAAEVMAFAGKIYVPMATAASAADTAMLAVMSVETLLQLEEIENSTGSRADKERAELRLLGQVAAVGGLKALHMAGLSAPVEGGAITLGIPEGGGMPVGEVGGEEAVTGSRAATSGIDPETGQAEGVGSGVTTRGSVVEAGTPGVAGPPRRPAVLIVGAERPEEFDMATALAGQGQDVTVVNPRATPAATGYQAAGGNFHEGGIETLPPGLQYDYIREEFPQPLGRTHVALQAVQARFSRLAPGGRLEIVTEANAEEFRQVFEGVGVAEYHCSVTQRELAPDEGPHSPAYVPAGERRIETVFVRPAEPAGGGGGAPSTDVGRPPSPGPSAAPAVGSPPTGAPAPYSQAPAPTAAYDPVGRTEDELVQDMNRAQQPGETPEQAIARVRAAAQALSILQTMNTYRGLIEEPPILEMRAHDAQHAAEGAHTIERHGPDMPLRRADAPAGIATVEGRIYGDPPWGRPANWSYKWRNVTVLNDTINTYLKANWEMIRSELAMEGTFEGTFDAGNAVGEGFFNEGQMGMGPQDAIYHQTSQVTLTLQLIPGNPPSFFVVRAFPAGRGF